MDFVIELFLTLLIALIVVYLAYILIDRLSLTYGVSTLLKALVLLFALLVILKHIGPATGLTSPFW